MKHQLFQWKPRNAGPQQIIKIKSPNSPMRIQHIPNQERKSRDQQGWPKCFPGFIELYPGVERKDEWDQYCSQIYEQVSGFHEPFPLRTLSFTFGKALYTWILHINDAKLQ